MAKGAPEREALIKLGLRTDDKVTRHTGQGTASIGFVFENAYLELLWVEDEAEFQAAESAEFRARARWRQTGASPFGIGLRNRCGESHPPPLSYRDQRGEWMKPESSVYVIEDTSPHEPEYFVVPPYMALPAWVGKVDTSHPLGVRRISRVEVTVGSKGAPHHRLSDFGVGSGFNFVSAGSQKPLSHAAHTLRRSAHVRFKRGSEPLLRLTFDDARQGKTADLRPDLPLIIKN